MSRGPLTIERVIDNGRHLAIDLVRQYNREGHCPLCGAVRPECEHVVRSRELMQLGFGAIAAMLGREAKS